jgi:hypothetical protein
MAEKKNESFTVTDRRLFTSDGEVRTEAAREEEAGAKAVGQPASPAAKQPDLPPTPTAAEQEAQADAYQKSSASLNAAVEQSGHSAKDLEMTFERFMASLYMSAMLQLGLMHEKGGEPQLDLIGARQTIDTLSLLADKTKGNLSGAEENFLRNCLYEVRMAYVEVTNSLSRPPQASGADAGKR